MLTKQVTAKAKYRLVAEIRGKAWSDMCSSCREVIEVTRDTYNSGQLPPTVVLCSEQCLLLAMQALHLEVYERITVRRFSGTFAMKSKGPTGNEGYCPGMSGE